jgi:mannobiose 2-epimerase
MIPASASTSDRLDALARAAEAELREHILPFWLRMQDNIHGGFVGAATCDGSPIPSAPKGAVLHARILWTFSAAHLRLCDPILLAAAQQAYDFIERHLVDPVDDGVFWETSAGGEPTKSFKHLYAHAFMIYGLATFHRASGNAEALELARRLWRLIERRAADPAASGYFESFSRGWQTMPNVLTGKSTIPKTFNTHLHLLEAYGALSEAWPDAEPRQRTAMLAMLLAERLFDRRRGTFRQHFDADWRSRDRGLSFGHNIEASWLLLAIADRLDPRVATSVRNAVSTLAERVLERAVESDGGVASGLEANGDAAPGKMWWVQAEALVGFLDAFERSRDVRFLSAAEGVWRFIQQRVVDRRGGEWHEWIAPAGTAQPERPKAGPWKCPYHNGRACLEVMSRAARTAS